MKTHFLSYFGDLKVITTLMNNYGETKRYLSLFKSESGI